ncbi:MAG: hypothetical protein AB7S37_04760 [Methanobacteriales archaeon]|nr:hypothetical protein [Methanothermobacter sp.]
MSYLRYVGITNKNSIKTTHRKIMKKALKKDTMNDPKRSHQLNTIG